MARKPGLGAYLIGNTVFFVTSGITEYDFPMEIEPVFIADINDSEGLSTGFKQAVNAFQPSVKFVRTRPANETPILRAAKLRSWAALHKVAKLVGIDFSDGVIEFDPLHNEGPRGGYAPRGDKFEIDATNGDVVAAIRRAFEIAT